MKTHMWEEVAVLWPAFVQQKQASREFAKGLSGSGKRWFSAAADRHGNLEKLGICESMSPGYGADIGRDTVQLIGVLGALLKCPCHHLC